jgi:hypothetical protein
MAQREADTGGQRAETLYPPPVAGSSELVHAMASRDKPEWAWLLQTERERRGWTKPEMARQLLAAAGYGRTKDAIVSLVRQIRAWENAEHFPRDWTGHYAAALEMTEAELFGNVFAGEPVRTPELSERAMVDAALDLAAWVETTNAGSGTIGYLTAATKRLTFDYARRPPLEVLSDAFELQRRTTALLRGGRQRLRDARWLVGNAAELLALISLLSGDVGRYLAADAFGYAAWTCAEEADSDMARALVLSAQSKTARWEGRYAAASALARRGFEICPPTPERIFLAAAEATALQSLGDIDGAWQAMGRAQAARDETDDPTEVATAWTCVRARQAAYALQVGLGADDPAAVLRQVHEADAAWAEGDPWVYGTWAQVRIGAALAYVIGGDPEGAAEELAPVFDLEDQYRVVTIVGRIGEVGRRLADPCFAGSGPAEDLKERIRAFRAGSLEHKAIAASEAP